MTKQYEGNIWTEVDNRGVVKIGFSRDYIDQQLMECFHVVQADRSVARKGQPIMVLETNDGTARIKSPINGRILTFNDKARNFPDRLSEEDVIMEVLPEGVTLVKQKVEYNDVFSTINNWPEQVALRRAAEQRAVEAVDEEAPQPFDDRIRAAQQRAIERTNERLAILQRAAAQPNAAPPVRARRRTR